MKPSKSQAPCWSRRSPSTRSPRTPLLPGGSYEVAASLTPSVPARLGVEGGACTFTKPRLEQSLPAAPHSERASRPPAAPATVYFLRPGKCTITAGGENPSERVSQSFTVAKGPPEQISFTSTPPSDATVGGSYSPTARSSLGWPLVFSTATPDVCKIVPGSTRSVTLNRGGVQLPPSAVDFLSAGTCTIDDNPPRRRRPRRRARSATVVRRDGPPACPLLLRPALRAPSEASSALPALITIAPRSSSKSHRGAPGTLKWRVTFKGASGAAASSDRGLRRRRGEDHHSLQADHYRQAQQGCP